MPYAPGIQADPSLGFRGVTQGFAQLGGGLADEEKKRKQLEEQNAFNQVAFKTLSKAKGPDGQPLLSMEEQQQFLKGNIAAQNGIVTAAGARLMQSFSMAQQRDQMQKAQMERQLTAAMLAKSNQPLMMNGQQAGVYDARGMPHYQPYGGAAGQQFVPPEDTVKSMKEAGYTFAPTSGRAGRWINTDGSKPDLDENGNPRFTADGSAYISGGKVKPLTQPMADARKEWMAEQQKAKDAAGPHWYDRFMPGKSKSETPAVTASTPTPAPTAAPKLTPKDYKALEWAQANPTDPRAAQILKKLGIQ